MREIKFRAWEELHNKMYKCIAGNTDKEDYNYICPLIWIEEEWNWVHSDTCIIMQYTGLKDKNGVEIYEGDIIKYSSSVIKAFCEKDEIFREVKFEYGMYGIDGIGDGTFIPFGNISDSEYEVVGNIYENPTIVNKHSLVKR